MEKTSFIDRLNSWARRSIGLKLASIGFLILILLIPASMLNSLIRERQTTRDGAIAEINSKWGGSQTIGGPVITIPYKTLIKNNDGKFEEGIKYAHFLPDNIKIKGDVKPEKRYRGIYVTVLYNAKLSVAGNFSALNIVPLNITKESFLTDDAFISIGITDMKGIKSNIALKLNDTTYQMEPGIKSTDIFTSGVSIPVKMKLDENYNFSFDLNINGSRNLSFLPFGKETDVELKSNWTNPSFEGSFLPDERNITADGFMSKWKVLQLNRNYPQQGCGTFLGTSPVQQFNDDIVVSTDDYTIDKSEGNSVASFGVKLMLPIDEYQKTMRSAKYNIMFIFLTFLTLFFMEILNKSRVHPIQYLLVGFAICLFYILLLSISEYLKFNIAYWIACTAILLLITFYSKSIFKSNKITALTATILALLYGFFFSILQLQDYALLMGSLGLLLILAVIMYLTRNINWYTLNKPSIEEHQD
ncbi:MAG: cell envelope integrity protein CreD [Bacteroidetes bacterium]|nr:cell envelope integrity protein CreD [Bacteroidota bacterium]